MFCAYMTYLLITGSKASGDACFGMGVLAFAEMIGEFVIIGSLLLR